MQCKETVVWFVVLAAVANRIAEARSVSRIKRSISSDDKDTFDDDFTIERQINKEQKHSLTVHQFAKHVLCPRHEIRRDFSRALKENYSMADNFATKLVVSLCISKGDVLDQFASDMFDKDGDGFINEYERNLLWHGK